jgi:preprotein translocase subunit SecB
MDQAKQPGVQIDQIVLFEAHFAHGKNAMSLPSTTRIDDLQFQIQTKLAGKAGEKSAILGVRASTPDDPDASYIVTVEVAMLVSAVPGQENLDPYDYVQQMGPAALYPFVREAVASLTMKGRFGPLWLKPYNFVAAATAQAETHQPDAKPTDALPNV